MKIPGRWYALFRRFDVVESELRGRWNSTEGVSRADIALAFAGAHPGALDEWRRRRGLRGRDLALALFGRWQGLGASHEVAR